MELVGLNVHTLPHREHQVEDADGAVHVSRATGEDECEGVLHCDYFTRSGIDSGTVPGFS